MSITDKVKKAIWFSLGMICLGIAYIGVVTPGIPWSTPTLGAAYCFAKSSKKWHDYLMNHKLFGPFIKDWADGRVYPKKFLWIMFICMDASLVILWFATHNWKIIGGMGVFFALVIAGMSRYPSTKEESDRRKAAGEKLGWFK